MCELSDLYSGQTAEWDDAFGGRVTGTVEYVSMRTGWVTLKLNEAYIIPSLSALKTEHVTHSTVRAARLTPRN